LDDLLKENLRMDTTNLLVSYELAKLRCDEWYLGLGHFLLDKMDQLHPGNQEILRLRKKIERKFGKDTYNQHMDFKKYLSLNPIILKTEKP
jgi:Tfp pilus assembly protein PilF